MFKRWMDKYNRNENELKNKKNKNKKEHGRIPKVYAKQKKVTIYTKEVNTERISFIWILEKAKLYL